MAENKFRTVRLVDPTGGGKRSDVAFADVVIGPLETDAAIKFDGIMDHFGHQTIQARELICEGCYKEVCAAECTLQQKPVKPKTAKTEDDEIPPLECCFCHEEVCKIECKLKRQQLFFLGPPISSISHAPLAQQPESKTPAAQPESKEQQLEPPSAPKSFKEQCSWTLLEAVKILKKLGVEHIELCAPWGKMEPRDGKQCKFRIPKTKNGAPAWCYLTVDTDPHQHCFAKTHLFDYGRVLKSKELGWGNGERYHSSPRAFLFSMQALFKRLKGKNIMDSVDSAGALGGQFVVCPKMVTQTSDAAGPATRP